MRPEDEETTAVEETACHLLFPRSRRDTTPHGATREAPEVVRSQKGQGKAWMRACTVVFWEGTVRAV